VLAPQAIDGDDALLDNKPVKLDVKLTNNSSMDLSYFLTGMTNADFDAFTAVTPGAATRTLIAIIVRHDTAARRVVDRLSTGDTLRVFGTVRIPRDRRTLSIVVDAAQIVER
jgi:hypothetical protein